MSYNIVKADGSLECVAGRPSFNESQYSKKADIVDNLDSTDVYKPLSANMGNKIGDMVGDGYDSSKAYVAGDICIYNNVLYKCLLANTGQLPTNTVYWSITSLSKIVKTSSGSGGNNNYSTDETVVGEWIDGKPIYRKVFKGNGNEPMSNTSFTISSIPTSIGGDIDTIVSCKAISISTNSKEKIVFGMDVWFNGTEFRGKALQDWGAESFRCITYILEYTKTTD